MPSDEEGRTYAPRHRREGRQGLQHEGIFGSSMTDLVRETGLAKGGIYNRFASKEELALEAFDYATALMRERFSSALEGREGALERLFAVVEVLGGLVDDPPSLAVALCSTPLWSPTTPTRSSKRGPEKQ